MGLFVIGMVLSTAAYRVAQVARPDDHTSRSILMVGYLSTIGAFVTGSIRAVSDIAELL
jgi:hypothetical protein